jgi:hypothetical protein
MKPPPPPPPQAETVNKTASNTARRLERVANRVIIFVPYCPLYSRSYSVLPCPLILRRLPGESTLQLFTFVQLITEQVKNSLYNMVIAVVCDFLHKHGNRQTPAAYVIVK